ncbi:MAG: 4-(cytidine 5'-diphospho)-2-C-methyl-D-erythritol kinase [Clostridiales bacterium]|nr:4-(cytidine 5'-diphospho)-2-C-methyl-D-erythritol kinase [Clostridiales bacterium]
MCKNSCIRIPAFAKINLYLDVMNRREDGFHEIKSIMHSVSLCDYISAEKLDTCDGAVSLSCTNEKLSLGEDNLVVRAARAFFEFFGIGGYGVQLHIEKNIPISAGLAGGSTDAAAALLLLNDLYKIHAEKAELCRIGEKLGSDVPFCIIGGTCLTLGRGEVIHKLDSNLNLSLVIAKGGEGVSTPAAYRMIDQKFADTLVEDFGNLNDALNAVTIGDTDLLAHTCYNTFEDVVLPAHAEAREAKQIMQNECALCAMLSGSGPSVFGVFGDETEAERVADLLRKRGYEAAACRSVI